MRSLCRAILVATVFIVCVATAVSVLPRTRKGNGLPWRQREAIKESCSPNVSSGSENEGSVYMRKDASSLELVMIGSGVYHMDGIAFLFCLEWTYKQSDTSHEARRHYQYFRFGTISRAPKARSLAPAVPCFAPRPPARDSYRRTRPGRSGIESIPGRARSPLPRPTSWSGELLAQRRPSAGHGGAHPRGALSPLLSLSAMRCRRRTALIFAEHRAACTSCHGVAGARFRWPWASQDENRVNCCLSYIRARSSDLGANHV
jgi:hypothetical protein